MIKDPALYVLSNSRKVSKNIRKPSTTKSESRIKSKYAATEHRLHIKRAAGGNAGAGSVQWSMPLWSCALRVPMLE